MSGVTIRAATVADLPFLWDMLFESAFTTDDARAAWRSNPQHPAELGKYLDGYGRPGDVGLIAKDGERKPLGAAWFRTFATCDRGDGILACANVPELAIAVAPEHRGRGIGWDLLMALARRARDDGYRHLMLSVDPNNTPALRLYERTGFTYVDTNDPARGTSLIMQLGL